MATQAGSGSGFIIDPSGLAVTNNHVVTGAATLEVYVGGDLDKSYNASVVGVSECNDLALIQIDTKDPLPTLAWQDTEPTVGQEVYAAGFPLGDPEFTLTRGIVAKAQASGETPWASIDSTIEHDANIQPGNSGGPLVGADGHVVAVNYATGSQTNTSQFFAIESELAQDVVDELKNGDFETLGINGQAVLDEEAGIAGVWVSGVAPGSAVDEAGVLPGDIVTSLNGLPIGTDGTMKDYCDVIRTSGEGRPIEIEVLRYDTSGDPARRPVRRRADRGGLLVRRGGRRRRRGHGHQQLLRVPDARRRHRCDHHRRAGRVGRHRHDAAGARRRHAAPVHRGVHRHRGARHHVLGAGSDLHGASRVPTATSPAPSPTSHRRPASAPPTTVSPTTTTACSPASTATGRGAAAAPPRPWCWWRCPPTARTRRCSACRSCPTPIGRPSTRRSPPSTSSADPAGDVRPRAARSVIRGETQLPGSPSCGE